MVDIKVIKSQMILLDLTEDDLARHLNISKKTLGTRFKKKEFAYEELEPLSKLLKINEPWKVFFATKQQPTA